MSLTIPFVFYFDGTGDGPGTVRMLGPSTDDAQLPGPEIVLPFAVNLEFFYVWVIGASLADGPFTVRIRQGGGVVAGIIQIDNGDSGAKGNLLNIAYSAGQRLALDGAFASSGGANVLFFTGLLYLTP